ncbi:hypothetical protein OOK41_20750 [Micromonospora sp. NBC_01655]|uniref:hypothetical protein n=1 Tax=unclassified Micromonospora TaxID=2617518 RepID=UPI001A9D3286|nr:MULTISPECIES: hypothetical protein [unclassified Micromonospora]MCX4472707.1 hypothetical protein [Micromonospora sp. NBC_01655]
MVRDVVTEVAPSELPVVAGLATFDDAVVVRRLGRRSRRREPLGFGLGEIVPLVTAVVWLVLDQVAQQAAGSVADRAGTGVRALWRRLFRRRSPAAVVPALTQAQLASVHQQVIEVGVRQGLERERAEAVADAVLARLVLAAPEHGEQGQLGPGDAAGGDQG